MSELLKKTEESRAKIEAAVYENFGFCPSNDAAFDKDTKDMRNLEFELETLEPDNYAVYYEKYY